MLLPHSLRTVSVARRPAADLQYITYVGSTSSLTSYTFSSISVPAGLIVVTSHYTNTVAPSSVVIGGTAGTSRITAGNSDDDLNITTRRLSSAATISIVVNFSVAANRCGIAVWAVTNNQSDTPVDTASGTGNRTASATLNSLPRGNVVVAGVIAGDDPGARTCTFTNATSTYNTTALGTRTVAGASNTTAIGDLTITAQYGALDVGNTALVAVSWR